MTIKRFWILSLLSAFFSFNVMADTFTVVIDPGHGGKDYGAIGHVLKLNEKDLNLDVALRLASKIRTAYPEVNVVLTRSTDVFIPLQERANIANRNNSNLFISIHTNSAESRKAYGAEVFILGTEKMEKNLDVAMRENAVMKLEADYQTTYQGFDPNSVDSYIMFELMQNQYMDRSLKFATLIQKQFVEQIHRSDRGVRQAAFWVLLKTACPSVLVEMGFVSNKEEEKYLGSDKGKREIAESIFNAFSTYYQPNKENKDEVKNEKNVEEKNESEIKVEDKGKNEKKIEKTIENKTEKKTEKKVEEKKAAKSEASQAEGEWTVQIFSSRKVLKDNDPEFKGLKGCFYAQRGEWYKYMYGKYKTKEEAQQKCDALQSKFKGCFVVAVPKE